MQSSPSPRAQSSPTRPPDDSPSVTSNRTRSATPEEPTTTSILPIAPNATFANNCRYVLGDSTTNPRTGFRFVATSTITNTGNIGVEVDVRADWAQGDAEPVSETKRARVDWRQKVTVKLSVPVTRREIDLMRRHAGPAPKCKVDASIVATYGPLH